MPNARAVNDGCRDEDPLAAASGLVDQLLREGPIGTFAASRLLGSMKGGKPLHATTIARWVQKGVRTPDGRTVKLEAIRLGGRLLTSQAAIVRFIESQQTVTESPLPTAFRSPTERQRESETAVKRLEDLGA